MAARGNLNEVWEQNRPFLVRVLGGAAVFLIIAYFVLSLGSESAADRRRRTALTARATALHRQFGDRGGFPSGSLGQIEKALEARIAEVCARVPPDLAKSPRLPTRFLQEKERECTDLNRLASQAAVDIKVALSSVDFHDDGTADVDRYEAHWATLACFKRLIEAVIRAGFAQIVTVVVEGMETEEVTGEPAWSIARYGVKVEVTGRFQDFLNLYAELHQAGRFLVVEMNGIRQLPGTTDGMLQGTVTGWAVRLVKTKERTSRTGTAPGVRRFKR